MRNKSLLSIVLILLIFSTFAFGQSWDRAKGIGLSGGLLKSIGGNVDRAALGYTGGLSLRYGFSPFIMMDLSGGYGAFNPSKEGEVFEAMEDAPYRTFLFPVNLSMRITPIDEGRFRPYALIGAGMSLWDLRKTENLDYSLFSDGKLRWGQEVNSQTEAVLIGGLGFETFLNQTVALDLQGRFSTLLTDEPKDNVGFGDANDINLELVATLAFYFGYFKDTDKDGIEDKYDADIHHAEDFDGFRDEDGAPDYDNDGDGILDINDKCPNEAEDMDGFEDEDGCPDPDNDGDGILDINDKCPNEAEDMDGFQDEDGCPDLDNDGDGIPDAMDKCPLEAETFNGYKDDDGCPDQKPLPLEKKGAKLVLQGVNFETGSAELTQDSYAVLDQVALGLMDNKEVEVEIRGYTDDRGADKANQKLSERRAQSVMQYLVKAGVDANRLKAVGYGEKDPIASNKTAEGRAQNRRIEFFRSK